MDTISNLECDVLVAGGGGAACMAAIAAEAAGAKVLIVDKGQLGKSGCSPNAHGGIAAGHKHPEDNWRVQMQDTLLSGGFLNDQEVVKTLCQKVSGLVPQLEQFGCLFNRDADGSYSVRNFGGHTYPRSIFCGDETGHEMMIGLRREILRRGIDHLDEVMLTKLVVEAGSVAGAVCLDIAGGQIYSVQTPSIVLATGDGAGIWPSASERQRGDGIALALEAGAELVDMEFIQYHPTHCWWPFGIRGSVSESFRAEGGILLNSKQERFMSDYDPRHMELATRDKISVCIYREMRAGRGAPHGGIYASVKHLEANHIEERLPVILHKYLNFGIDVRKEMIEVRPQPHYLNGGVKIDSEARTNVQGLYAAGAITGGVHGANRLGSNSLTDILVFGDISGRKAARWASQQTGLKKTGEDTARAEMKRIQGLFERKQDPVDLPQFRRNQIELMDQHAGVLRSQEGLRSLVAQIEQAREVDLPRLAVADPSRKYNFELKDALEMFFRLDIQEASTKAALLREESRGGHFREDFPERNDAKWLKNIVVYKKDGALEHRLQGVHQELLKMEEVPEYASSSSPWH